MKRYDGDSKKSTNNNRLKLREMSDMQINRGRRNDYNENLNRLMMERDNLFEQDSNAQNKVDEFGRFVHSGKGRQDSKFGEITGNEFNIAEFERGLPIRSQNTSIKKQLNNEHFDFDLFDDKPSKLNVSNYDPSLTQGGEFADISTSMSKMSSQLNPTSICSSQIDRLNNNLYYFLFNSYENAYMTNGYGLFNLFASLFFPSAGTTEIELKKFFGFPRKEDLFKGLSKINDATESIDQMIRFRNFLIIGSDVPYNPNYHDQIKDFCIFVRINTERPNSEAKKMNDMIHKIIGYEMRNVITPENLNNLQLMLLSTAVVNPVWSSPFDKISTGTFQGLKYDTKMNFLHSVGKCYGYFEDTNHQMLEIKCMGNNLTMGFLLYKEEESNLDDARLHFYINHMRECVMDEVKVPMFEDDFKLRYSKTFQKLGLNSIFTKMISPQLFPENVILQDVVQNIKIIINDNAVDNKQKNNKGYVANRRFICDRPFLFYFRLVKTDTILMMGMFQ